MDFGFYPPEVNSSRMYSGPGSGPMLAAAQAWGALADELFTTADGYQSAVSELTSGAWSGPSSMAMSAAAMTYAEWLHATAAQAEETSVQARAAAAGYETAFAMTVPPAEIATNRSLLAVLVATNFLGMNTPAIASTEAQYAEMWAQDAVAMYNYAGLSAAATVLAPFSSPDQTTNPDGVANQAAAAGQTANTSAGNAQSTISAVPQALSAASTGTPAESNLQDFLDVVSELITIFGGVPAAGSNVPDVGLGLLAIIDLPYSVGDTTTGLSADKIISEWEGEEDWPGTGPAPISEFPAPLSNLAPGTLPMSAGMGEANTIGELSVPANWTVAAPEVRSIAKVSPLTTTNAAAAPAAEAGAANTFNQMGIGGMAGQAMTGPPATDPVGENGRPVRLTGSATEPAAEDDTEALPAPRTVMTGVAAAIRDIAQQRDAGRLSEQEYVEQKKQLLQISFGQ